MHRPARRAATIGVGAVLAAGAMIGVAAAAPSGAAPAPGGAAAAPSGAAPAVKTVRYYAFDINNGGRDPGFIPVPGTNPKVFSQGDELIVNDQLTTTRKVRGGYPIVGHDAGVCTLTRLPEKFAEQTVANCVITGVWKNGSLTLQGAVRFKAQQPQSAVLAVTGGTGHFAGAAGTLGVSFTKNFKILTIKLKK